MGLTFGRKEMITALLVLCERAKFFHAVQALTAGRATFGAINSCDE